MFGAGLPDGGSAHLFALPNFRTILCWRYPPPLALYCRPMLDSGVGMDGLLASLSAIGACEPLTLPGVDDPITAPDYVARVLGLLQAREIPFEQAWSSTINRIQAPQGEGGFIENPRVGRLVAEERALLEEDQPRWRAAYERRPLTTRERALCTVGAWRRLDAA